MEFFMERPLGAGLRMSAPFTQWMRPGRRDFFIHLDLIVVAIFQDRRW